MNAVTDERTEAAETVTLSSKGQIAIPKKIRDSLRLNEGIKLQVAVKGNSIILSKPNDWRAIRASFHLTGGSMTEALLRERASDRLREDRK